MMYPREIFCANEDMTRANMRAYDALQERIMKCCLEINPDYYSLGFRQKREIRRKAEEEVY